MLKHVEGYCDRCGHELAGQLCGFCLIEVLGLRVTRALPVTKDPTLDGPFLEALFVKHWTLRRPLIAVRI